MTNFHTHTLWCDGVDSPETMAEAAIEKGFTALGFSSHAMIPGHELDWTLDAERLLSYAEELNALKARYRGKLRILVGVEADYVKGGSNPDRGNFAAINPDYVIGAVHTVVAEDGALVSVDETSQALAEGIRNHFAGSAENFVKAYFRQQREMIRNYDFDIVAHPDLVRKFNSKCPYFDEKAAWYLEEIEATAEVIAKVGRIVEVNTGAIVRGWLNDAYPSAVFREQLRRRSVRFILSSDAHSADGLDGAFDRFGSAEEYITL